MERESIDEIGLHDIWNVVVKRGKLIIGVFLISILCVTALSLLMPKIYRGKVMLVLTPGTLTPRELISITGKLDVITLKHILPKTHQLVNDIKLEPIEDSDNKFFVVITAKNTGEIPEVVSEFIQYANNIPFIKDHIEQEKERRLKESEELSRSIESSVQMLKTYEMLLKEGKIAGVIVSPVESYKRISDLKIEKTNVEQAIRNLKGVEAVGDLAISERPVAPDTKKNIAVTSVIAIFAGISLAFFKEYIDKSRAGRKI
jgi:capsular polysaccharide biosynthesis protein